MRWLSASYFLALAAAGLVLAILGPPRVEREEPVSIRSERLGPRGLEVTAQGTGVYERVIEVGRLTDAQLDALTLAPDPLALRTRVVRGAPDRVLDPDAVRVMLTGLPRVDRPLALQLSIDDALADDTVVLSTRGKPVALTEERRGVRWHAQAELPPLNEAGERLVLRWEGRRGGRRGVVELEFEIEPRPRPAFWVGEGLAIDGPTSRALSLMGYRRVDGSGDADLYLLSAGRKAPVWLSRRLDRGAGVLLVAEPGRPLDPSLLAFAPVVPGDPIEAVAEGTGSGIALSGGAGSTGTETVKETHSTEGRVSTQQRIAATPPKLETTNLDTRTTKTIRRDPDTTAIALVLVIDDSRSMRQPLYAPRIEMAKKSAFATASKLGPDDQLAVVKFGRTAEVVHELSRVGGKRERAELRAELERLTASGDATNGLPGLLLAWRQLKRARGRRPIRHVLILTDGEFHDMRARYTDYMKTIKAMRREGIGVTGIGIFQEESEIGAGRFVSLQDLVRAGGGQLLLTKRSTEIPSIVLGNVDVIARRRGPAPGSVAKANQPDKPPESRPEKRPEQEPPVEPSKPKAAFELLAIDTQPVLRGLEDVKWPKVSGFLPLDAQVRARVHLSVGPEGHVFLAASPFGLGRVAVFAGSDGAPWCSDLVAEDWFPRLVSQTAAWLLPAPAELVGQVRRSAIRVLSGDGSDPGVLQRVAKRVSGTITPASAAPIGSIAHLEPGPAWPWIVGLLGAFLVGLAVIRLHGVRVARDAA